MLPLALEEALETAEDVATAPEVETDTEDSMVEASEDVKVAKAEDEVITVLEACSVTPEEEATLADDLATEDSGTKVVVEENVGEVSVEDGVTV